MSVRGTGRTTRLLQDAIELARGGETVVFAVFGPMDRYAISLAEHLIGAPLNSQTGKSPAFTGRLFVMQKESVDRFVRGGRDVRVVHDHYWGV